MSAGIIAAHYQEAASFAPTDVSGLIQWLDAAAITGLSDFDPAPATWLDSSGLGNHATKASTLTYRTGLTAAGGPAIHFPALGDYTRSGLFTGTTAAEVFALVKAIGDPNDNPGLWVLGGSDRTYYPYTDGKIYDGCFTSTRYSFDPAPNLSSAFRTYNVSCGGGTWTARLDGSVLHSASRAYVAPANMNIGGVGAANLHWEGYWAQFLVYNRVLTTGERASVHAYLAAAA